MLRQRAQFLWVQQHGRRLRGQFHTLLWHATDTDEPMCLGLTVSRKVGKSVVRQKVKRRLREMFRLGLPTPPGYCLVCIAHPSASQQTYGTLLQDLDMLFQRMLP